MYNLSKLLIPKKVVVLSSYKTKVMKYLNVAEKRDAAKNIAAHISRSAMQNVNGIYTFEAEVFGQKSKMVMTSVSGHLLNYEFVNEAVKRWNNCEPKVLFKEKVAKTCLKNYVNIKKTLEFQIRDCDGLIIWTDCDREGENIGFEIIDVCKNKRRNIQIYRAKFSEITAQSVTRALNNLKKPNEHISKAVDVRQELDLKIGAVFTRFQTLTLQRKYPEHFPNNFPISYGSCQFPTLGFVVERYMAITNFVSESFWKLQVTHNYNNLTTVFSWDRVRIFDEEICKILYNVCLENGVAKVEDVKTKPKSKWRPLPLDTVELEKLASRKLNISAKETMKIAEELYIAGNISYPRTETNQFSKEINLKKLVELQKDDPNWGQFAQSVLTRGPNPRQGNKSDEAHPPIHPTKYCPDLRDNKRRVYEFIVRSFLACCSEDARGLETTVTLDLGGETFGASGLVVRERNYLDVYPYDKWSTKEIGAYEVGATFVPTKIDIEAGKTTPPRLLTEADLIALMEKHGIGTDATHADHIETIKRRQYVSFGEHSQVSDDDTRTGRANIKTFMPTRLGMSLVRAYDSMDLHITKPRLRAHFEADLKLICEGKKQPQTVLHEQLGKYEEIYNVMKNNVRHLESTVYEYYIHTAGENGRLPHGTESATARIAPTGVASSTTDDGRTPSRAGEGDVLCLCGRPAREYTVKKRNQNYGKKFFKCHTDEGCDFFKWAETTSGVQERRPPPPPPPPAGARERRPPPPPPPPAGARERRPPPPPPPAADESGPTRRGAPRRCSHCRECGHNIKNCPNKDTARRQP